MSTKGDKVQINMDYIIPPPDKEEELLSKLVFGDNTDFQSNLANFDLDFLSNDHVDVDVQSDAGSEDDSEAELINNVNDDQLFFVDDGNDRVDNGDEDKMDVDSDVNASLEDISSEDGNSDAWEDSDDERIRIDITASNKSKKLRTSYAQSQINGSDYVHRLRAQFERIYPKPKWVDDVSEESNSDNSDAGNSDDEYEKVINGDINALSKILESSYQYKDISNSILLPKGKLDIIRLKDANAAHPSKSAVQSLSFHPNKPLLLTGGFDRTLRIYHIDGKNNHLVSSLYLKDTPVQTCTFYVAPNSGNSKKVTQQNIFTGGRRRYMHSWDLSTQLVHNQTANTSTSRIEKISRLYGHQDTQRSFEKFKLGHFYNFTSNETHGIILLQGNNGWINIIHATTGVWLTACKIEGVLTDFCIDYKPLAGSKFQTILIAANTSGEIWEFNLSKNNEVQRRWKDAGGMGITIIQVGGGTNTANFFPVSSGKIKTNTWLAIGSESGYVNIYDRRNKFENIQPVASLDQLTTTISSLVFSSDGQILCMASRAVKDALRLVHLPSCTVFSNWPTSGTPFGRVTSVAFSSRSEMLAVGNEQGKVRLWRLNHY
ncbi:hypothetical protein TPHA_0I02730 [Tetrapisispora phaffii CBS 4417]|uniref:Uncharacterized protein n=1 Tax=Tetrapisispora phaffii (strain ATCC 24235 / CBS 4417 / NBRC 1672 / NRRL Y-8282 / UCD 70-5) TaxID=1071381 RepID=G8BXZ6_TETPH|nr:hypothetical protein TPHA_0I02730 [Tetrapisispora phaffii CBS 4417]CCE64774.1 hypothetical protein TPHA_0I02730 [Tetrapisispora phaffii CBS 4417]